MRICKYILSLLLVFIIPIGFITCDNYEFPKSPYPRIETLVVTDITENGVTFQANLIQLGNQPITNHGFVWGITEDISITSQDKVQLGAQSNAGKFEAIVKSGLEKDVTYFVKAFVATNDYFVYGKAIEFTSKGSTLPIIESILPTEGTWGDTILLKGNYFSAKVNVNKVKFGNRESTVIFSNDSIIKCIVPNDVSDKTVQIDLEVAGNKSNSEVVFTLLTPFIESFAPSSGTFDDIVTIGGSNFNKIKEKNFVSFNGKPAEVIESSANQLKVRVPRTITTKENQISVTVNLQTANTFNTFEIIPPVITSLSSNSEFTGATLTIEGNNFNPSPQGNTVLLGGTLATILSSTKSQLTIRLPHAAIYKLRAFPIEVVVAEQSALSSQIFTLKDTWLRKADVPHGIYGRFDAVAFAIDGVGFVGLGSGSVSNNFWKYNPTENLWSEIAPFPGGERAGSASFVIGGKAYVGLGGGNNPTDFWLYDPIINSWSRVADFPLPSYMAKGFTVKGKGYILRRSNTENFWQYDPISNDWTPLPDFPTGTLEEYYPYMPDAGFVIDDRLYIYAADATTGPNQLWEYDFIDNKWNMRAEPGQDYNINTWTNGFALKGYGYIRGEYYMSKYDPLTDSWIHELDGAPGVRELSISFLINNKIYFGTSFHGLVDMWEFDPDFE